MTREAIMKFAGLYVNIAIWVPLVWLLGSLRKFYGASELDIFSIHWLNALILIAMILVTLVAQAGIILLDAHMAKTEKKLRDAQALNLEWMDRYRSDQMAASSTPSPQG